MVFEALQSSELGSREHLASDEAEPRAGSSLGLILAESVAWAPVPSHQAWCRRPWAPSSGCVPPPSPWLCYSAWLHVEQALWEGHRPLCRGCSGLVTSLVYLPLLSLAQASSLHRLPPDWQVGSQMTPPPGSLPRLAQSSQVASQLHSPP